MKKFIVIITLCLAYYVNAQSYIQMEVITLKSGQEDEYLKIEEFFSEVKKRAVNKGHQTGQAIFKNNQNDKNIIEGLTDPDKMVCNLYDSKEQMEQSTDIKSITNMAQKGKTKKKVIKEMLSSWSLPRQETRS